MGMKRQETPLAILSFLILWEVSYVTTVSYTDINNHASLI